MNAALNQMIATIEANIAALEDVKAEGAECTVVQVGTLYLCENNGKPSLSGLVKATRYTAARARVVARGIKNGNNEQGKPVEVSAAVVAELAAACNMLEMLKNAA